MHFPYDAPIGRMHSPYDAPIGRVHSPYGAPIGCMHSPYGAPISVCISRMARPLDVCIPRMARPEIICVHSRAQAAWALGNITGDSTESRDAVLRAGALPELLRHLRVDSRITMTRNVTWTLTNFCR